MAASAYLLSAISLRAFSRFMVPPPTEFQLTFPWLARTLEETSFLALLTGYIAAYWFASDNVWVPATEVAQALACDFPDHATGNHRLKPVPPKSIAII
jgi:hypothetical protein